MLHGYAVGVARKVKRQQSHVQHAVAKASQLFQSRCPVASQNANGLLQRKSIVAGGNRRVCGEDAPPAHRGEISFSGRAERSAAQLAFKQRQGEQCRVAFVHVVHIHPVAKRVGHASSAHAQHNLLLQAVVAVAAVKVIGQTAVPSRINLKIRIKKIDRDHVPVSSYQVIAPCTHGNNAVFHRNRDTRRLLGAEVRRIPLLNVFALNAFAVEMLLEESLAVQQ